MKKILLTIVALAGAAVALADEGMWLLPYIEKMNIRQMQAYGCTLSADEIYSPNQLSLKDAIVHFGSGCTGEIVSNEGLLLTNYHCGHSAIQSLSSVENDYLQYGFAAANHDAELPVKGLYVRFVRTIEEVTAEVLINIPSIASQSEFQRAANSNIEAVRERLQKKYPKREVIVRSFFGDNRYFAFTIDVYRDVRLVFAPPFCVGKFGDVTDNWMWPRHTCDFAVFRVYAGADGKTPAAYSEENVPYRPEKWLKVSTDGYREGDFAMIMGFPGRTTRYMTSYEIDRMLDVENPQRILIRGERQDIMQRAMESSDEIRIKYSSKFASSSNYWKNSIGKSRGIRNLRVRDTKEEEQRAFIAWAEKNTLPEEGYIDCLSKIEQSMTATRDEYASTQYMNEAFLRAVEIFTPVRYILRSESNAKAIVRSYGKKFYRDFDASLDREVAKRMFTIARRDMKFLPSFYKKIVDRRFHGDIDAFTDWIYDNSLFSSYDNIKDMTPEQLVRAAKKDPAMVIFKSIDDCLQSLRPALDASTLLYNEGHRRYIAGRMLMEPDRAWASDANSTIRMTYGQVLPYEPRDGVRYNYFTTLRGVIEKEDKNNPREFTVPDRLKEIFRTADYGKYADTDGTLHTDFLVNCDITGGNSGSPVLNGKGELLGLAFDGNWEAMSGDVAFAPALQRTIAVDIRYVLLIIDRFAGASHIAKEIVE